MNSGEVQSIPDWVHDAIFYQIFPDRFARGKSSSVVSGLSTWGAAPNRENFFGGDLAGIREHLDELQDLGVNALYLNPIFKARTNHRYDTVDYFQVDALLGDRADLIALVEDVHRRGMRIILDGVFNHCGEGFPAFQDLWRNGKDSLFVDWFSARSYPLCKDPLNYMTCGGCTYLPKLNHANPAVRDLIFKVARYWLEEAGIDGWRLDVPFKIAPDFWREFRQVVRSANPQAYLVGEVWREASPWIGGDIFDGVTNYRLRDLIFDYVLTNVLDGEDFGYELKTLLAAHGSAAGAMLNLLDSHDTARVLTTFKGDVDLLKIALLIQMTLPGAPMIYYGDEVGLTGETDPDCRRCMPWDRSVWNLDLRDYIQNLIGFRKQHPALRHTDFQVLASGEGVFAYRLQHETDVVICVVNPRQAARYFSIPTGVSARGWRDVFSGQEYETVEGKLVLDEIPARGRSLLIPVE